MSANHHPHTCRHEHTHAHSHAHAHHVPSGDSLNRAFRIGIGLNLFFVCAELAAGFYFGSLALLSDAGHNLSDVVSLILALIAFRLAKVKANDHYTYGYKKSTILVSLLNAVILLITVGALFVESFRKLSQPEEVAGEAVAWVAAIGVLINGFTAYLFLKDKKKDLNIKGAYLHMAADTLVSAGVVVAGIAISHTGWYVIDPIIGIVVAGAILVSTWRLLHDSLRLSLDGVPAGIDRKNIKEELCRIPGVTGVHHIHIWAISTTENALTAHIIKQQTAGMEEVKHLIRHRLEELNIRHVTLEFENPEEKCEGRCGYSS